MDRTERQLEGIKRWVKVGGHGSFCGATGCGKTRGTITLIQHLLRRKADLDVLIVVPTQVLKDQGMNDYLIPLNLVKNCRVAVLKSAAKEETTCDLLVIDEIHTCPTATYASIFTTVSYNMILGLTATMERLDGKEVLIKQYAPVCDTITFEEAEANGWVSPVKQYCVMLDVPLDDYRQGDKKFNNAFAYFNFDFTLAMNCATKVIARQKYAKLLGVKTNEVTAMAMSFMKAMRERKNFVMSHPHKMEVARKIIEARKDKKIITFSATIKDAESIGDGFVLHSKKSKKDNQKTIDAFNAANSGVLHSSHAADAGVDVKGLSVGIILATNSSKTTKVQRSGRVARFEPGKKAEMFTLIIRGTQEFNGFRNSTTGNVIYIDEKDLDNVLAGKEVNSRQRDQITNTKYRY